MSEISQVVIIEYQNLARHGMERILTGCGQLSILDSFSSPEEYWTARRHDTTANRPDVILYGPPPQSEDTACAVQSLAGEANLLVVSDFAGPQRLLNVIRAGALGCVSKQVGDQELTQAVRTIALGGLHVSPGLALRFHGELRDHGGIEPKLLAPREMETVRWLADGLTHGQIARRMGLTEATVSTYVKRIRSKLNVGNKADLTRTAIELGLLRPGGEAVAVVRPAASAFRPVQQVRAAE